MSVREWDRLKVLHEVERGHLTQRAAGQQLGVSDRWVRKLLVRVKKEGDRGIVHRLRTRESNRRLAESVRVRVLKLVKAKYRDFGPTLACEYLAKDDGVEVSKETLRQLLIAAGLRRPSTTARGASAGGDPESRGRTIRDLGLHDPLPGEDLSDRAWGHPPRTPGRPSAGGTTPGWERGGEVSAI
jgi:transposase